MARILLLVLISIGFYFAAVSLGQRHVEMEQEAVPSSDSSSASWNQVVAFAKENLPQTGKLVQKSDGYVYLKVDDRYINELFPMLGLKDEGFRKPPFFRSRESPGAHITVFYAGEGIDPVEVGKTFGFTPKKIRVVKGSKSEYFAILIVDSPELEALRNKYALKGKLQGHAFHISLAKKTVHPF